MKCAVSAELGPFARYQGDELASLATDGAALTVSLREPRQAAQSRFRVPPNGRVLLGGGF